MVVPDIRNDPNPKDDPNSKNNLSGTVKLVKSGKLTQVTVPLNLSCLK